MPTFLALACAAALFVYSCVPATASPDVPATRPTLGRAVSYPLGGFGPPRAIAIADVNGDAHADLLAAICDTNVACGTIAILLGNGDGTFRGPMTVLSGGNGASAIAVADVTADTRADLVVANFASDTVSVIAGRGDGSFEPPLTYPTTSRTTGAGGPAAVAVADLDGDAVPDLVVAHAQAARDGAQSVSVLRGRSGGGFAAPVSYAGGGLAARAVHVADMNRDRRPDLVVTNDWTGLEDTAHGTVSVLLGRRDGGFAPAVPSRLAGWGAASAAVTDVDGDRRPDVIVAEGSPKRATVLLGRDDGTLAPAASLETGGIGADVQTRGGSVAVADVTADGLPDVLAGTCFGDACAAAVSVFAGTGNASFAPASRVAVGGSGAGLVAAADLDGNGAADAVVATCTDGRCSEPMLAVLLQGAGTATEDASHEDSVTARSATEFTTMATQVAAGGDAVYNLRVVSDASPDLTDLPSFVRSATSRWASAREKVWALYYWMHRLRRQTPPMVLHGFEVTDPIRNLLNFGYTMCSTVSGINQVLYESLGLRHEYWDICNHTVANVEYDGRFHMIDNSMSHLVTLDDGVTLASVVEASADSARLVRLHSLYSTSPNGFLTGSDTLRNLVDTTNPIDGTTLQGFSDAFCASGLKKRDYYYNWNAGHRHVLNLRPDERYVRYYRRLGTTAEYWIPSEQVSNPDPASTFQIDSADKFGLHANGLWSFTAPLAADTYARAVYGAANVGPAAAGGLRPVIAGEPGDVIYKVQAADVIASQKIQAQFVRSDPAATATLAISLNHGRTWVDVATAAAGTGTIPLAVSLRNEVTGAYETLLRVRMANPAGALDDGISLVSLSIDTITHVNAKALPALNLGRNEIHVEAGPQQDTMVLWPDLRGTFWQKDAYAAQNIASQGVSVPRKYTAVVYPSNLKQDAWLTYRFDAPGDVTEVTYGGRLYNYTPGSYIDFLHSFDGGATWTRSYRLDTVAAPYDVIHYETVRVPAGVRTVLFKYLIHNTASTVSRASGLYAVRMEVNHQPAGGTSAPVDLTWTWKEMRADRTTATRSHRQRVAEFPFRYVVNVGGSDHPVMESLAVSVAGAGDQAPSGYGDGVDAGGEKYVATQRIEGVNLARNRPYTVSRAPTVFQGSAGSADTTILTDGVVGGPQSGGVSYWWTQCWKANQTVQLQVDLGHVQAVGAVRAHVGGYPAWDALKGQVQDTIEVQTSADGVTFTSHGPIATSIWRKDVPVNYMLPDTGTATGWNFELRLPSPVQARFVRYVLAAKRSYSCASELQVFDRLDSVPFDMRLALPALPGAPTDEPWFVDLTLPAPGATVTAGTSVTLAASASAPNATVTHVEFLVDGEVVADDVSAPWTTSWTPSGAGSHALAARAYTDAGEVVTSSPREVTVSAPANLPPSATLTAPADGGTFTAGEEVALSANAIDADGTVTRVEFLVDGVTVAEATSTPWQATWIAAGAGARALAARAYDDMDAGGTSAPVSITVQAPVVPGEDVVLWAADAPVVAGWTRASDATAAGGARLQSDDLAAPKLSAPLASPATYFELTFDALAGRGYRLWIRGKAQANSYANDSVFVQFDGSTDQAGRPAFRIGTTSATVYSVEDCSGCGVSGWGWADNGYGSNGPLLYFDRSGPQRVRVQVREDGLGIDQIVLSSTRWVTQAPGAPKNDGVILARTDVQLPGNALPTVEVTGPAAGASYMAGTPVALAATAVDPDGTIVRVEILVDGSVVVDDAGAPWEGSWTAAGAGTHVVTARAHDELGGVATSAPVSISVQVPVVPGEDAVLWAADAAVVSGWTLTADASAAGGARLQSPDLGIAKLAAPLASPAKYFELTFHALAGRAYRLWIRGTAQNNAYTNDSAFVQFDGSVNQSGAPVYRIGTTDATVYSVEDCTGCGVAGWGWADNGYGAAGPLIYFATDGPQRVRVQVREDGLGIDQVVLSSTRWVTSAPGATKNDTVVLPKTDQQ